MGFNNHPFVKMLLHVPPVDHIRSFARFLGLVHRNIRILQQLFRVTSVLRILGDPDAGGNMHNAGMQLKRFPEALHNRFCISDNFTEAPVILEQDDELVSAEPEISAAFIPQLQQPLTDLYQQLIAKGMAQCIINIFEIINIKKE
ncbi:hypothetical protein D3C76_1318030 [compost metagenome]